MEQILSHELIYFNFVLTESLILTAVISYVLLSCQKVLNVIA